MKVEMDQSNLLKNLVELNDKSRLRTTEGKDKKRNTFQSVNAIYLEIIFPTKEAQEKGRPSDLATRLKILASKQRLQRLPIALHK